jgi:uncharacterized membrane protein
MIEVYFMGIKKKSLIILLLLLIAPWFRISSASAQTTGQPQVRAIMFWLSTCGNCEYVINEVLPPLQDQYGDQLEILLIELVTQEDVDRLYETAAIVGIAKENVGVPFMLIGENVLSGSDQIPSELPGLIQMHLAEGGLEYPDYPSLAAYLPESINSDELSQPNEENEGTSQNASTDAEGKALDAHPAEGPESSGANGFTLAGVILVAMVLGIVYVIYALIKGCDGTEDQRSKWIGLLIPLLTLAGIGVSGYLTYVETQAVEAICGPVGDCNAVQNSSYARLFGVLPIGILGLIGFAMILIAWLVQWLRDDKLGSFASLAMLGMALFGTIFSIYLTYLEIWVIEAVCIWCLSSAVLITTLLLLSVRPASRALDSLGDEG